MKKLLALLTTALLMAFVGCNNPELDKIDADIDICNSNVDLLENKILGLKEVYVLNSSIQIEEGCNDSIIVWITLDSSITLPSNCPYYNALHKLNQDYKNSKISLKEYRYECDLLIVEDPWGEDFRRLYLDELNQTIETYSNRIMQNQIILQTLYVKRAAYK